MKIPNKRIVGQYLKEQREKNNLSLYEVAKRLGISQDTVKAIEEANTDFRVNNMYKLLDFYEYYNCDHKDVDHDIGRASYCNDCGKEL